MVNWAGCWGPRRVLAQSLRRDLEHFATLSAAWERPWRRPAGQAQPSRRGAFLGCTQAAAWPLGSGPGRRRPRSRRDRAFPRRTAGRVEGGATLAETPCGLRGRPGCRTQAEGEASLRSAPQAPRPERGRRTEPRPEAAGPGRVRGQPLPHSARALPPFPGPRALPSLQPARPRDFVGCSSHSAPMSPPLCSLLGLRFRGCSWELEKLWASENAKEAGALPLSSAGRVDAGQEPRALPSLPRP